MASNYTCRVCLHASRQFASPSNRTEALRMTSRINARSLSSLHRRTQQQTTNANPASTSSPSYASPTTAASPSTSTPTQTTTSSTTPSRPEDAPPLPDIKTPTASQLQAAIRTNPATSRTMGLAQSLRKHAPGTTETYIAYGSTELMFKSCSAQADYDMPQAKEKGVELPKGEDGMELGVPVKGSFWYEDLNLQPVFNTWAQITMLHMYILTVRLRMLPPKTAPIWHQHLTDHFFTAAEDRMLLLHRITQRAHRTRYLKDLHQQWRGVIAAYDEGLIKGDAIMAAAVWRNVFGGKGDVDPMGLAGVVGYLRREVRRVSEVEGEVIEGGGVRFGESLAGWVGDKRLVLGESEGIRKEA